MTTQRSYTDILDECLRRVLGRHESIDTTMKFYVGREAEAAADVLWDAYEKATGRGNTLGNTTPKTQSEATQEKAANPTID